ncbi:MAG: hypothetical protein Q9220_001957 [cf. Caloplaca sp. 1 TL-2023]
MGEADHFPHPSLVNEVETLAFDPGSPDGQSWSSLSEASAGFASDLTDSSPTTNGSNLSSGLAAEFDAFLRSADSTPGPSHYPCTPSPGHYRAESAPRQCYRTSPYPANSSRGRSFSTGSVALARTQCASAHVQTMQQTSHTSSEQFSPSAGIENFAALDGNDFNFYCQSSQAASSISQYGHASDEDVPLGPDWTAKQTSPSPGLAKILHSSSSSQQLCEHHFAGSTSPPDLFGPLSEEQSSPPPEDFECEESAMPRAQDLRFQGDLYTPRYVRGHGNKREGWCGTCKPGRWLVLKNSAFWYDKSFSHGISAATGAAFEGPRETRRMKGNPDVWEGLCGSCGDWIALISSKKKGTTWFRHAYKKVKDTTKRRREVTQGRNVKAAKACTVKSESRERSPFSVEASLAPLDESTESHNHGHGDATFSISTASAN